MKAMVDKDDIRQKLSFIDLKLHNLETLKEMERQDFLAGFQAVDAAKYNFQVCIEALIDVSNHIIARECWGIPSTSTEVIRLIIQHGVLGKDKEPSLVQMVMCHHSIVHLYEEVDDSEIYRILQENLDDIKGFIQAVLLKFFSELEQRHASEYAPEIELTDEEIERRIDEEYRNVKGPAKVCGPDCSNCTNGLL